MGKFNCFFAPFGKKKPKDKEEKESPELKTLQVRIEHEDKISATNEPKSTSFSVPAPFGTPGNPRYMVKVMNHESPVNDEATEVDYEGEDEHDESLSMKRDYSDFDLQAHVNDSKEQDDQSNYNIFGAKVDYQSESVSKKDDTDGFDGIQAGHVSDPGIGKAKFWASPKLQRSCSNLETRTVIKVLADTFPPSKSFEELQKYAENFREDFPGSPQSVTTHLSADKVMLKKHSSSQILPSRSRRLWWKLFLWSHRNLQTPKLQTLPIKPGFNFNQHGGYSSDTLEPNRPLSDTGESLNDKSWGGFQVGVSGLWPQNQWVAFPSDSPLTRVDEWVKELEAIQSLDRENDDDDNGEGGIVFPPSPERSSSDLARHPNLNLPEEIVHANVVIRSLNSSSTVAHISGMGLKVIPLVSHFTSLRSVNLSGNLIAHVTTGSLPKGLHTLNLSRNKITSIEGFRELTRLRVLDLSYNRISRIGQGLSNCTLIKELYLAGNKISDIEGLHRLLKLTVLDLSFNKVTTVKALGQLVANYNTLLALNLLGNPIQNNINDDQLRKGVCSLLPKLAYLNKQAINPHKAREVATESVTKAALGNGGRWNSHKRPAKRVNQGGSTLSGGHRSSAASVGQKSRQRLKSRTQHQHNHSPLKNKSSAVPSSSG